MAEKISQLTPIDTGSLTDLHEVSKLISPGVYQTFSESNTQLLTFMEDNITALNDVTFDSVTTDDITTLNITTVGLGNTLTITSNIDLDLQALNGGFISLGDNDEHFMRAGESGVECYKDFSVNVLKSHNSDLDISTTLDGFDIIFSLRDGSLDPIEVMRADHDDFAMHFVNAITTPAIMPAADTDFGIYIQPSGTPLLAMDFLNIPNLIRSHFNFQMQEDTIFAVDTIMSGPALNGTQISNLRIKDNCLMQDEEGTDIIVRLLSEGDPFDILTFDADDYQSNFVGNVNISGVLETNVIHATAQDDDLILMVFPEMVSTGNILLRLWKQDGSGLETYLECDYAEHRVDIINGRVIGRLEVDTNFNFGAGLINAPEVTSTSITVAPNHQYTANNAGLVTLTLATSFLAGECVLINGKGAGLYRIGQQSGQQIYFGSLSTTSGVTGYIDAVQRYSSILIKCITDGTEFVVLSSSGNFDVI